MDLLGKLTEPKDSEGPGGGTTNEGKQINTQGKRVPFLTMNLLSYLYSWVGDLGLGVLQLLRLVQEEVHRGAVPLQPAHPFGTGRRSGRETRNKCFSVAKK
jgi:hypothetical protein